MAHFVNNPPDKVNLTGITELNLLHDNGTATVCVWGMPRGKGTTIKIKNESMRFDGRIQNIEGNFSYYYVRGLIPGDEIAAFFYESDTDVRQNTGWLPVKKVSAYHSQPRPSVHKSTFILDSYGSDQRHPPVQQSDWIAGVEETLRIIKNNSVGRSLIDQIANPVTFKPYIGNELNADAAVSFTAQICNSGLAGGRADEVLFHELVHVLEGQVGHDFGGYADIPVPPEGGIGPPAIEFNWDGTDFLSVTATNVYSSLYGRRLRHDHHGFGELAAKYRNDALAFRAQQMSNITKAKSKVPAFCNALASPPSAWSPFKDIPPLLPVVPVQPGPGPSPSQSGTLLRFGSSGPEVSQVQDALNGQGLPVAQLDVDGKFGAKTRDAVVAFQRQSQLNPDGIVGPLTRKALGI